MKITDIFDAGAIAIVHNEVASNKIAYLGAGLFPSAKKMGLDLKHFKTTKGLPVSLMPSAFDAVSTIRSREGFKMAETEMAYFKESMIVTEADEQEIMRVQSSTDPYAQDILSRLYDDANTLVEGASVVPERMRMQLLSSATATAGPTISISGDGATYSYNYDPDGSYVANNVKKLSGTAAWSDTENSDPIQDVIDAQDAVEALTGTRPSVMIISQATMKLFTQNAKIKAYILAQNATANVMITKDKVKEIFKSEAGVDLIVYTKQFKNESGVAQKFFPDAHATLIPSGTLGKTWYGVTPEERTGVTDKTKSVSIVDTGVAVAVTVTDDPIHTKTTVSEICLPSFERMDETYQILW